jgi:hypothetical protein
VFGFNYSSYERDCNRNSAELCKSGFSVFTSFSATARRINLLQAPAFFNRSQLAENFNFFKGFTHSHARRSSHVFPPLPTTNAFSVSRDAEKPPFPFLFSK